MKKGVYYFDLYSSNKSLPYYKSSTQIENSSWSDIERELDKAFNYGGKVDLKINHLDDAYIKSINFDSVLNRYRIILTTNDKDRRNEILEWWEPGDAPYRGVLKNSYDDELDARTFSDDIDIAKKIFFEFFENAELSKATLMNFRSQWNPKA